MKIPDTLIRVSKDAGKKTNEDLTDEEKEFFEIYNSTMPELRRLQYKMSVCLEAEVSELTHDCVTYSYEGNTFRIEAPKNAFKICGALEKGTLDALAEMCAQKCVKMNGRLITDVRKDGVMLVDELQLLSKIVARFFFQIYTG